MKYLHTYNESLRDKMTPKSKEDIEKTLQDYLPHEILRLGYRNNMWDLVKRGIEEGASVHMDNDAALRFACQEGELEIVKYLMGKGADVHTFEDDALVMACYSGNLELIKYLVNEGADIHAGQIEKVLRAACADGHPDIVEYLLEQGADQRMIVGADVTHGKNRREIMTLLNKYTKTNEGVRELMTVNHSKG
jgi:ankyrin repeat protein